MQKNYSEKILKDIQVNNQIMKIKAIEEEKIFGTIQSCFAISIILEVFIIVLSIAGFDIFIPITTITNILYITFALWFIVNLIFIIKCETFNFLKRKNKDCNKCYYYSQGDLCSKIIEFEVSIDSNNPTPIGDRTGKTTFTKCVKTRSKECKNGRYFKRKNKMSFNNILDIIFCVVWSTSFICCVLSIISFF